MKNEQAYLALCQEILNDGHKKSDRTNTGTYSLLESKSALIYKMDSPLNDEAGSFPFNSK